MTRWFVWFGFDYAANPDEDVAPLFSVPRALEHAEQLFCGGDGWPGLGYTSVGPEALGLEPDATGEHLAACLRRWFAATAPPPEDIVAIWFSGHGVVGDAESPLLLQGGGDRAGVGMPATVLGELLGATQRTLVVADCCHSGLASADIVFGLLRSKKWSQPTDPRSALRDAGHEFIAACHPGDVAKQLDLVLALEHVIMTGQVGGSSQLPLRPDRVVEAANAYLSRRNAYNRIQHGSAGSSGTTVPVLPTPRVNIPATPETMKAWIQPKARGAIDDADERWRFQGRGQACQELVDWLQADVPRASRTLCVVTGGPGAGKSAVLSYVLLLSGRVTRRVLENSGAIDDGSATMLPRDDSIDAFVTAGRGRSARDLAREIIGLLSPEEDPGPAPERALPRLLRRASATIVVDSVDAADDPDELVDKLLLWATFARVIVGCRSGTGAMERLSENAQVIIDLDSDDHYSREALVGYVVGIAAPDTGRLTRATELATIIERAAGRSFERARLEATALLAREELPDPSDYRPASAVSTKSSAGDATPTGWPAPRRRRARFSLRTAPAAHSRDEALRDAMDKLAAAVRHQWRREAAQRAITAPATISVSWRRTGRSAGARPLSGARPRPMPLASPSRKLSEDGMLKELVELYEHPDVDKVVVIGEAGSGKSGILIQLLLESLGSRGRRSHSERYDMPVPVLMTLGDWNPHRTALLDFASGLLLRDYGTVLPGTDVSTYRELLDDGRIALFLDGLDEMPEDDWGEAIERIQEASQLRVVLTARREAGEKAHVPFAARVELEAVPVDEAADYLRSACRPDVHPELWEELVDRLARHPESVAADVLTTPLMLGLALSALDHPDADPRVLADDERFADAGAMRRFLIGYLVIRAYDGHHDGVEEIPKETAERHLRSLARHLGKHRRDLAWWRVRRWFPGFAPAVLCVVFMGVVWGTAWVLGGPAIGVAIGLPGVVVAPLVAWVVGSRDLRERSDRPRRRGGQQHVVTIIVGLCFGATMVMAPRVETAQVEAGVLTVAIGLIFGLLGGLAVGVFSLTDGPLIATPQRVSARDVEFGIVGGTLTGLVYGLAGGPWRGLAVGITSLVGFMLAAAWTRPPDRPEEGATPLSSYRRDVSGAALLAGVISATATVSFAIVFTENHSVLAALALAFVFTFPYAFMIGACTSQACALALTRWGLRLRGAALPRLLSVRGAPADDLTHEVRRRAGFLEDARRRQILRSVGTLYQFRHALLQDYLLETADAGGDRVGRPTLDEAVVSGRSP